MKIRTLLKHIAMVVGDKSKTLDADFVLENHFSKNGLKIGGFSYDKRKNAVGLLVVDSNDTGEVAKTFFSNIDFGESRIDEDKTTVFRADLVVNSKENIPNFDVSKPQEMIARFGFSTDQQDVLLQVCEYANNLDKEDIMQIDVMMRMVVEMRVERVVATYLFKDGNKVSIPKLVVVKKDIQLLWNTHNPGTPSMGK